MQRTSLYASVTLAALGLALALPVHAQTVTIAADYSGNYSSSSLFTTQNGGSGFAGPFTVTEGDAPSFYKYNSRLNGGGGGGSPTGVGINDADNVAFGLNSNPGSERVQRVLSTPLTVGSTFSFAFDNGYIENDGYHRMFLGSAASTDLVEFGFKGGTDDYEFNGVQAAGFAFTDGGLNVSFTLNTPLTYTLTATKLNDNSSYTYNGTLASTAGLDTISFQTNDSGHNPYHDFYFNNLSVVAPAPEPSQAAAFTVGLLGLGGLCLLRRRRGGCTA